MKFIIQDIEKNCPECYCNTEETIRFLQNHGDLSYTSNHYREVWDFYNDLLKQFKGEPFAKRSARITTCELFMIKRDKFKHILKWGRRFYPAPKINL